MFNRMSGIAVLEVELAQQRVRPGVLRTQINDLFGRRECTIKICVAVFELG
jgi:hypothetical protein